MPYFCHYQQAKVTMLTKYILQIGDERHEITSENIRNWDQIKCAYSRKDFNGVVRSFSSQFEFVGTAYDLLFNLFIKDGVKANAILSVLTITDRWEWEEQFSAPLDFSTASWDGLVLSIAAIDNGLAALISANKSTKYEFEIGNDITPNYPLYYDRVELQNSVVHELMDNVGEYRPGTAYSDGCIGLVESSKLKRAMVYVVGDAETYENSPVSFQDQTENSGSYFLKIEKAPNKAELNIVIDFEGHVSPSLTTLKNAEIHLMKFDSANPDYNSSYTDIATIFKYDENISSPEKRKYLGCFTSVDVLKKVYPNPEQGVYAIIGSSNVEKDVEAVYFTPVTNTGKTEWVPGIIGYYAGSERVGRGEARLVYCKSHRFIFSFDLSKYSVGSMFALLYKADLERFASSFGYDLSFGVQSKISTSWVSRAKAISIDAFTPTNIAQSLINKICEDQLDVTAYIDNYDPRIENTFILAAESIRGIPNAKFYSSFNEFCDFMQTVFGYTYYLGEVTKSKFSGSEPFDGSWNLNDNILETNEISPASQCAEISFMTGYGVFAVLNTHDGKFYTRWEEHGLIKSSDAYNDVITGKARLDKLYIHSIFGSGYYIDDNYVLQSYSGDANRAVLDSQDIRFVHRDKLFTSSTTHKITSVRDVQYSVDNSAIYSAIEIGYDKKDYEAECGRDEWNFTSVFSTGIIASDKTLSLKSKYRSDCYGLEFLAQKRAKDSTDNKSDNDVFFVYCSIIEDIEKNEETSQGVAEEVYDEKVSYYLVIHRSVPIVGALSDTVFNGEYSPHRCLKANEAFIAKMGSPVNLIFASSDGNSEVVIDGIPCNSDMTLKGDLMTLGQVSFTTGDTDFPDDVNALISFTSQGVTYRGFLLSVELKYAHNESAKYKLIVKDIIV